MFASVRHAGSTRPQDAMNIWVEEKQEDHFKICVREVKTFDGKHQNIQVVSQLKSNMADSCVWRIAIVSLENRAFA